MTPPANPSPEVRAASMRIAGNVDYFIEHGIRRLAGYRPDVAAVRGRVVVGIGTESTGGLANRCALVLAQQLGVAPVVFPGAHTGFGSHPAEFARILDETLTSRASSPSR
jgi:hypothetical protein